VYIAVVRPGETLDGVAARAGVPADQLIAVNGLPSPAVTEGQALIVPSNRYVVEPGDTLWSIAARSGLRLEELQRANPGAEAALYPGRPLYLPSPRPQSVEVLGYLPVVEPGVTAEDLTPWAGRLTWVAIFTYVITPEGDLPPIDDEAAIQATYAIGARPLMSIANLRPGGAFEPAVARALFTNPSARERAISTILQIVTEKGYAGVDCDIENIDADMQAGYVDFLTELKARLGNLPVNVAVPPKYDEETFFYARGHDYAGIGQAADRVFLMNYEFHWVGGPPGPIAPLPETRRVLLYAASLIPRQKLLNGISTTAYDWPLPDTPENRARPWPDDEALQIAIQNRAPIRYDERAQSPWFRYTAEGQEREVWFEDARSLMAKLRLIRETGVAGLGIWNLGALNSQLIALIDFLFSVETTG
jgi:spore germination protein